MKLSYFLPEQNLAKWYDRTDAGREEETFERICLLKTIKRNNEKGSWVKKIGKRRKSAGQGEVTELVAFGSIFVSSL